MTQWKESELTWIARIRYHAYHLSRRGRILKPLIISIVDFLTDIYGLHRFSEKVERGHLGIFLRK